MEKINQPNRRSIRLKYYDYSQPGEYFITICTYDHECMFGDIVNGKMQLNEIGKIVEEEWMRTEIIRPDVQLDSYVIMPNHVHGIIILNESGRTFQSDIPVVANCHSPFEKSRNIILNNGAYINTPYKIRFVRHQIRLGQLFAD